MPGKQNGTAKPLKKPKGSDKVVTDDDLDFKNQQKANAKAEKDMIAKLTKKK
eukprot:CAMPEP_0114588810 /NCGR_PEP_ID=MMETSP0125-20121206/11425_1 /TAXON_ID=485358 ORGANISM="Aristerostoma sp., Strain ATCC 50986" /NCGR_SAMPLE_ID=MMETSP0125 /ASSEMBLY_ACC=CAM_ASM_000245 /LENGTH=51 /DNA_ID=CAMNT_0001785403 /DNA_START=50 /DNA_END=205 /DNA_ORIENTATION=-